MNYNYKNLKNENFEIIYKTMIEAFADYALDMTYMTETILHNRAIKNGLDLKSSVGVYLDNKMVGFTLVGIGDWQGHKSGFDIATGIIKEHRGKGIAGKMFDFCKTDLTKNGVEQFILEVLDVNEAAIKAYKKSGFEISRDFECYEAAPSELIIIKEPLENMKINELSTEEFESFIDFADWEPSWENSYDSIRRIPDEVVLLGAYADSEPVGLLAFYPALKWIMNISVAKEFRRQGIASSLLEELKKSYIQNDEYIRLINIESTDKTTNDFAIKSGFTKFIGQHEMNLKLSN